MNILDLLILFLILLPVLLGLKNGFLKSIFSLLGIVAGLFLATRYNEQLSSVLAFLKIEPKLLSLISFILIAAMTYFILSFIAKKISGMNSATKSIDRLLGAGFGFLKGIIIASLFLIFTTNTFNFFGKETIDRSKFYGSVINAAPMVYDYLIKFFPDAKNFYEQIKF